MEQTPLHLPSAIVFDFGGVLIGWDPHPVYAPCFNNDTAAIDRFLQEIDFPAWNAEQDRGRPYKQGVLDLSERFPHYAQLIQRYDDLWQISVTGAIQPTVDILLQLKQMGWPVYGLSNWSEEKFCLVRPDFPFLDQLDHIVISGAVKAIKPEPEIYQIFLQQVERRAEECLFIDDSAANIAAADRLGFQTIHFHNPKQLRMELESRGILSANGHTP